MMVGMKIRMTMKGLFAYRHGGKMVVSFDMLSVFFFHNSKPQQQVSLGVLFS